MNLRTLRLFNQVAHSGSFSAAAERAHISQPAVSKAVADLEAAVGLRLLDRRVKPVTLTDAGRRLFRHSELIFNAERDAQMEMRELRRPRQREIRIAASQCLAQHALPVPLLAFMAAYPDVHVTVAEGNLHFAATELGNGAVNFAVIEGITGGFEHLSLRPWIEQDMVLCAPADHRLALLDRVIAEDELAEEVFVLREGGSATLGYVMRMLPQIELPDRRHIMAESTATTAALAAAGGGLVLAPAMAVRADLDSGALVALDLGRRLSRTCSIARVAAGESDDDARALEEFLVEFCRVPERAHGQEPAGAICGPAHPPAPNVTTEAAS